MPGRERHDWPDNARENQDYQQPEMHRKFLSTTEPAALRRYRGGPSLANVDFTVFLEIPSTRAISEIDTPADTRNRRISAQSSTLNTCSSPARFKPGSLREAGQLSVAAHWSVFRCRRHRKI